MSPAPTAPPVLASRGVRWWLLVSSGVVLAVLLVAWNASVTARCNLIEVRQSVVNAWPFQVTDYNAPGLGGAGLDGVSAVARVQSSGSEWIDVEGWDSCLRPMTYDVQEILWVSDGLASTAGTHAVPPLPLQGEAILPADARTGTGEFFVFFSYWVGADAGVPTDWWAGFVFDSEQRPVAGLDEVGVEELAALLDEGELPNVDTVRALVGYRQELFLLGLARAAGEPFWDVGPRTEALLRFRGESVRDYLGTPELDVWLEWDPVDRRLGWTRNHLPDGAAAALEIDWGNGEVVVIHHSLTSDSVTSVGLLSSVGLTGPEALVPGGGEVSIRGQYAKTTPLSLVLFDEDGDIAIIHPVPGWILQALDDRQAVAVDLDLRGAFNWRTLDRPPS
jgi:hypothetical protein